MSTSTDPARRLVAATSLLLAACGPVQAGTARPAAVPDLPLTYATQAVNKAAEICAARGFKVSAAAVDTHGQLIAFARGDGATPHTNVSSFRKAYTVVTLGPVFNFTHLGSFASKLEGKAQGDAIASLPDILLLAGGVAIEKNGAIVGALGVGGAPGGDKDEACAQAALEAIPPL